MGRRRQSNGGNDPMDAVSCLKRTQRRTLTIFVLMAVSLFLAYGLFGIVQRWVGFDKTQVGRTVPSETYRATGSP
jgi:hypothetical protein